MDVTIWCIMCMALFILYTFLYTDLMIQVNRFMILRLLHADQSWLNYVHDYVRLHVYSIYLKLTRIQSCIRIATRVHTYVATFKVSLLVVLISYLAVFLKHTTWYHFALNGVARLL